MTRISNFCAELPFLLKIAHCSNKNFLTCGKKMGEKSIFSWKKMLLCFLGKDVTFSK